MNTGVIGTWFLTYFPHGGEIVRLMSSMGHMCTGVLLIYLCLVMFSLLIRGLIPNQLVQHLNVLDKDAKTAFSLMQACSAVGFSIQIGYLMMQEPWLSFGMFTGFMFIAT